nr:hypothetical protein [Tanacetum cinerariifolium]
MALGYKIPFYLKQAQKKQQSLYDGKVLLEKHDPPVVHDSEETLQLTQESRQKMKQLNKEIKPANYTKINHLSGVFLSQSAKSREELYFSNAFKTAIVSKPISIPNEEFSDDTTPSVARKFLNEIKRLQAQLGDLKGKSKDTSCVSDTLHPLSQKLENENMELEFQVYVQKDNTRGTSTKFAKQSILRKLPMLGIDNTKTKRPQPRSNTKKDRVPSASTSSCNKNNRVKVEEHHRNLPLSKNKKHMSSACNNIKLDSQNVISKVVCAMCKQCLISINHDVCLRNYVNGKTSRGKKQKANVSTKEKQKKQQPKVIKTKKVGFIERLAKPKPSKPRFFLRWSPTGRLFDLKGKIIASSESESQSDCSNGDNACTSNTLEPKIKRFPNSTSLLGRVYFVEGLGYNLFLVGQFCDSDLEVFQNSNIIRNIFVLHVSKKKSKRASHPPKLVPNSRQRLHLLHVDLCGPMRIASINGKRYVLVIMDDYSHYTWSDREDIRKLGAKGNISFFIGYSADSCAYKVYNRRTKKIIETMNVSFDELSAMDFEQRSSKPRLQSMTSGQISSGLDLTYALSTITTQQPTEAAKVQQVRQTSMTSTSIAKTTPTPTNSSSQATLFPNTSQDVDELNSQQQHAQQQGNQAHLQTETIADNVS